MDKPTCVIDGCDNKRIARGWCHRHYKRWQKYGNPEEPQKPRPSRPRTMCITNRCRQPLFEDEYCEKHYLRYIATGSRNMRARPLEERFWEKVQVAENGCWDWTGFKGDLGYGKFYDGQRVRNAHRVWWEHNHGTLPEEIQLDHLCRNTSCVNPGHLEPVTAFENNILRSASPAAFHYFADLCNKGHAFTPENTYIRPDNYGRQCRTCRREAEERRKAKRRAL